MLHIARIRFSLKILGNSSHLQQAIDKSDKQRVVAWFTASWCGPCKSITPHIQKLSESSKSVDFYKIDIDQNQDLAEEYEVASVPTFILFKDKVIAERVLGANAQKVDEMVSK
jgi:thioredoxin 1